MSQKIQTENNVKDGTKTNPLFAVFKTHYKIESQIPTNGWNLYIPFEFQSYALDILLDSQEHADDEAFNNLK